MDAFLVRLWHPADETEDLRLERNELHGVVEPLGDGEPEPFRDGRHLLELLRAGLARGKEGVVRAAVSGAARREER